MNRNKLYILLAATCTMGYIWLAVSYHGSMANIQLPEICFFKHLTNIPCPSCGTTRSVLFILNGDILKGIEFNPFGLIIILILAISPLWILYDMLWQKSTLFISYCRIEYVLKQKWAVIPAITLVLANWIWNIYKGF